MELTIECMGPLNSMTNVMVLCALCRTGGMSQSEFTKVDRGCGNRDTVYRATPVLAGAGLITRRMCRTDHMQKTYYIEPTAKGRAIAENIERI